MRESQQNAHSELATAPIGRLMLRFSVPCVLSMLVSALYNIVDQIFIGNKLGYLGNAATNVVYPFTVLALALALMIGDGAAAMISLSLGRGERDKAAKSIGSCIVLTLLLGLLLTLLGYLFMNPILRMFGVTDTCHEYAVEYMRIILIGIPFYMLTSGVNGSIRADGSPKYAMIATVTGALINLVLDPVMIFGMNMGMSGAALATIIGQIATCILSLLYFRRTRCVKLNRAAFRIEGRFSLRLCQLGVSSLITQVAIVIVIGVANNAIYRYGPASEYGADIPLSAVGIVMKVFAIVISFAVGIAVGGQPIVGYNYGAKNYDRVKKTYRIILLANCGVGLITTLLFELCPQLIVRLFGAESELYNTYACLCFRIFLGSILLCCIQKASSIFLQAIGRSLKSMLLSISRDVVFFVPGVLILSARFGVTGMLWAAPIADVLSLLLTILLISTEFRNMQRMQQIAA